ncbi:SBBP repeat-containing protein [Hymenobacter norwichensis]|uniref:SBBP repeat-containing protein n=1 Tax=Hymenobacter norwichensis TaxID=223903 RepID=UPI0003B3BBF4|nr:SBBP repeat-containing protein [Hymenobacter norwichensis]
MKTIILHFAQLALVTLSSMAFGPRAVAQTTPAWVSVSNTGEYFSYNRGNLHLATDPAGNVYELGMFSVAANVGHTYLRSQGSFDGYLGKYNPDGTAAWVRQFGSTDQDGADDVAFDAAGNAYVVGSFTHRINLGNGQTLDAGTDPGRKIFLIKYDPAGNPLWAQQSDSYPGTMLPTCPPVANSLGVQVDGAGHVNVTCVYSFATGFGFGGLRATASAAPNSNALATVYMARFSAATGTPQSLFPLLYSTAANGNGLIYAQKLLTAPDGGTYLVANYVTALSFTSGLALPAPTSPDMLVAKYNAAGQVEWARTFGGPNWDEMTGAAIDAAGNVYVSGSFRGSLSFGTTTLPGAGAEDGYVVKYSSQGNPQWARSLAGPGADLFRGVCADPAGNVYVTGSASSNAQFGTRTFTSAGKLDMVVAAYTSQGVLSWVQQASSAEDDEGFSLGFTAQGRLRVFGYAGRGATFGAIQSGISSNWIGVMAELAASPQTPLPVVDAQSPDGKTFDLYPNPATTEVHLKGIPAGARVQVLDALGRIVRETAISTASQVSVRGLAPGLYTLRATDAQGQRYAARVSVE